MRTHLDGETAIVERGGDEIYIGNEYPLKLGAERVLDSLTVSLPIARWYRDQLIALNLGDDHALPSVVLDGISQDDPQSIPEIVIDWMRKTPTPGGE